MYYNYMNVGKKQPCEEGHEMHYLGPTGGPRLGALEVSNLRHGNFRHDAIARVPPVGAWTYMRVHAFVERSVIAIL